MPHTDQRVVREWSTKMSLYTERNGLRIIKNKTYNISISVYTLALENCKKYYNNLTWKFSIKKHNDFTDSDYIEFHEAMFLDRIKLKIPDLCFSSEGNIISPKKVEPYNQYALLDYIEFIGKNIKDITEGWNHPIYKNFWRIECQNTCSVFSNFQSEINELFEDGNLLYRLNDKKEIERIVENEVLSEKILTDISLIKEDGLKKLLETAIKMHKSPKQQDNKVAVEKLWDAFERLKSYYATKKEEKQQSIETIVTDISGGEEYFKQLFDKEFHTLNDIGNSCHIRHSETWQVDITDIKHYDYFYNRCLSLIALAIQYLRP